VQDQAAGACPICTCSHFSFLHVKRHYYISVLVQANGDLDFASGNTNESNNNRRRKPTSIPYAFPRTQQHPEIPLPVCMHKDCQAETLGTLGYGSGIRHGHFCNGSMPKWESRLVLKLLSPAIPMKAIADQCHSVILASGSLAPLPSLCAELGLEGSTQINKSSAMDKKCDEDEAPKKEALKNEVPKKEAPKNEVPKKEAPKKADKAGRLQNDPMPLEANHVVDLPRQLYAVAIGNFPDGSPLSVTYQQYNNSPTFYPKLGHAIASVVESIPFGGVLVFFPSYRFLKNCINCWNPANRNEISNNGLINYHVWDRFIAAKGKVIVEPTESQEKFEEAREAYTRKIDKDKNCILLAVFRGKMSEGISFNDDYARGVICVGLVGGYHSYRS
jgi:hypothetical protein